MEIVSILLGLSLWTTPVSAQIDDNALKADLSPVELGNIENIVNPPQQALEGQIEPDQGAQDWLLEAYAIDIANKYGISTYEFVTTLERESGGWQNIQSQIINSKGEQEDSHGICQIHAPSHPEITREQMYDPYWCIEWSAKEFSEGRAWQWTEWRKLKGLI
jgi:hypothetical protein